MRFRDECPEVAESDLDVLLDDDTWCEANEVGGTHCACWDAGLRCCTCGAPPVPDPDPAHRFDCPRGALCTLT